MGWSRFFSISLLCNQAVVVEYHLTEVRSAAAGWLFYPNCSFKCVWSFPLDKYWTYSMRKKGLVRWWNHSSSSLLPSVTSTSAAKIQMLKSCDFTGRSVTWTISSPWASGKQWTFHPLGLHNAHLRPLRAPGPSQQHRGGRPWSFHGFTWTWEAFKSEDRIGNVPQSHSLLKHNLLSFDKVKVCEWDAEGGFAGIGRLKLMPRCSRWRRLGSGNVYKAYVVQGLVSESTLLLCLDANGFAPDCPALTALNQTFDACTVSSADWFQHQVGVAFILMSVSTTNFCSSGIISGGNGARLISPVTSRVSLWNDTLKMTHSDSSFQGRLVSWNSLCFEMTDETFNFRKKNSGQILFPPVWFYWIQSLKVSFMLS